MGGGVTSATILKVGDELANYQRIKAQLQAVEDIDARTLLDTLEGETELHEALLVVAEAVHEDEDMAAAIGLRIAALQARKSRIEASAETKRNIILMAMERADLETVKGPLVTLTKRRTAPQLVVVEEATIPARFWKAGDPKLDKKALKAALDANETVDGARLSNGGVGLTMRVK
jgi:hypothetical protein